MSEHLCGVTILQYLLNLLRIVNEVADPFFFCSSNDTTNYRINSYKFIRSTGGGVSRVSHGELPYPLYKSISRIMVASDELVSSYRTYRSPSISSYLAGYNIARTRDEDRIEGPYFVVLSVFSALQQDCEVVLGLFYSAESCAGYE